MIRTINMMTSVMIIMISINTIILTLGAVVLRSCAASEDAAPPAMRADIL